MLTAIEGVFRNGQIELRELPENIHEARVIVTFLEEAESTRLESDQGRAAREHLDDEAFGGSVQPLAPEAFALSEERLRAFQSLVASLPEAPAVPLDALDRENLYS